MGYRPAGTWTRGYIDGRRMVAWVHVKDVCVWPSDPVTRRRDPETQNTKDQDDLATAWDTEIQRDTSIAESKLIERSSEARTKWISDRPHSGDRGMAIIISNVRMSVPGLTDNKALFWT